MIRKPTPSTSQSRGGAASRVSSTLLLLALATGCASNHEKLPDGSDLYQFFSRETDYRCPKLKDEESMTLVAVGVYEGSSSRAGQYITYRASEINNVGIVVLNVAGQQPLDSYNTLQCVYRNPQGKELYRDVLVPPGITRCMEVADYPEPEKGETRDLIFWCR